MSSTASPLSAPSLSANPTRPGVPLPDVISGLRGLVFVIVCAAMVAVIGYKKPANDWDMIAYVGSALHDEGMRGEAWRAETYAQVRAEVTDHEYAQLVGEDSSVSGEQIAQYRAAVARDSRALEQQLPFYRVKLVYIELLKGAHRLGLSYVKATYAVSGGFAGAMALLFGLLLIRLRLPLLLLPVGIAAANICAVNNAALHSLASLATPDAFSCFCALACLWLALRNDRMGFVAAALAPLARPDFIILSAALIAAILYSRPDEGAAPSRPRESDNSLMSGALSLACAAAIYIMQNHFLGAYSFVTLFNFSFMGFAPYPETMAISHNPRNPRDYLFPYALMAKQLFESRHFVIYGLVIAVLAKSDLRALARDRFSAVFVFTPLAYVAIHLSVFPEYFERFFTFAVVALFLWLARGLIQTGGRDLTANAK